MSLRLILTFAPAGARFMQTKIKIKGKFYKIDISEIKEDLIKVKVDGEDYFFTQNEFQELIPLEKENYSGISCSEENGVCLAITEKEIINPIAGVVSGVYVKEGERLKFGQRLITLMAMKMENEIVSEGCGQVKEIRVKENQSVSAGEVLIILE